MPDEDYNANVCVLEKEYPRAMPHFFSQDPDYVTVKESLAKFCVAGVGRQKGHLDNRHCHQRAGGGKVAHPILINETISWDSSRCENGGGATAGRNCCLAITQSAGFCRLF